MKRTAFIRTKRSVKILETKLQGRKRDKKKGKRVEEKKEHQSNTARDDKANASEQRRKKGHQ